MDKRGQTAYGLRIAIAIFLILVFFAIIIYYFTTRIDLGVPK